MLRQKHPKLVSFWRMTRGIEQRSEISQSFNQKVMEVKKEQRSKMCKTWLLRTNQNVSQDKSRKWWKERRKPVFWWDSQQLSASKEPPDHIQPSVGSYILMLCFFLDKQTFIQNKTNLSGWSCLNSTQLQLPLLDSPPNPNPNPKRLTNASHFPHWHTHSHTANLSIIGQHAVPPEPQSIYIHI